MEPYKNIQNVQEFKKPPKIKVEGTEFAEDDGFLESFKLANFVLGLVGLRVFYEKKTGIIHGIKTWFFFVVTVVEIFLTYIAESLFFLSVLGESFLYMTEVFTCLAFCAVAFVKLFTILVRRKDLENHYREIYKLWPKGELPHEVELIKKNSLKRLRLTSIIFFWAYFILITLYNSDSLNGIIIDLILGKPCKLALPYLIKVPFDPFASGIFQFASVYLTWSGYISAMSIVGQDCLYQISCSHVTMLLEILEYDLMNVVPESYSYPHKNKDETELIIKLNKLIKRHEKIIEIAEVLEITYNFALMFNIVIGSFVICLVGFQASIASAKQLVKFSFSTFSTLLQAFILCWYGDLLIEKSTGLSDAAYQCRWYNTGPRFKSALMIIMIKCRSPIHVTAGKFSMVSLKTFANIASTSWSYFTLLRTVYDPNSSK